MSDGPRRVRCRMQTGNVAPLPSQPRGGSLTFAEVSGDAAYLPVVHFNGVDQHFVGNTGVFAEVFPESGTGSGVQLDALLSYYLTPQWSVGLGGRYWGMWTTPNGQSNCTFGCGTFTAPFYFKAQVEQVAAFVQTSYKFDWGGPIAATY
jgi:hypothetical protein